MASPCANCGNVHDEKFCPACGQKRIHERITFHESVKQTLEATFNVDKGFLYNFIALLRYPEKVLISYLGGGTQSFFPPFRYMVVAVAINTFLLVKFHGIELTQQEFTESMNVEVDEATLVLQQQILNVVRDYMSLIIFLLAPLSSWGFYVLYRRHGLYFGEHVVIYFFLYAQVLLLSSLVFLPFLIPGMSMTLYTTISALLPFAYFTYAHSRFFKISVPRAFMVNVLGQVVTISLALTMVLIGTLLVETFREIL